MSTKNHQKGFTLIEMLLVVLLLALTIGLTGDMLLSLIRSNTKTQVMNEIEQQANFVTLKLEKELRDALEAETPDGNTLTIKLRSNSYVSYQLSGSILQRKMGVASDVNLPWVPLTSDASPGGVAVSCNPTCFQIIGTNPQVVKTDLKFDQAQAGAGPTYKGDVIINSSIVIRSSYQ